MNIDLTKINNAFVAKEIYDHILYSYKKKKPLSFLRVGDGETLMLCPDKIEWQENYRRISQNHLGYVLEGQDSIDIKNIIEDAIVNCDILGVAPKKHREINEFWDAQHSLIEDIQLKNNILTENVKYCSLDAHMHLLEYGLLNKLLSKITEVVIISSRDLERDIAKKYPNLKDIEYYLTEGEFAYEQNPIVSSLYPETYKNIVKKIREKNRAGQICLFGAGFIGKGLGSHFKKAGGIAIDIGSVFDLWAGKRTRGEGKSNTAVNLNHVLNTDKIKEYARSFKSGKIKGFHIAQHKNFQTVFNPFLKLHKFTHVLEIGTYRGGFTKYLRLRNAPTTKILSYDIQDCPEYNELRKDNIDIQVKNIFNENYSEVIDEHALAFLNEPGRKLILCDGGNKAAEFNCLSNYLKIGDFIMAHDYSLSEKYFQENIQGTIWNSCEIIEEEIFHASIKNKLIHYKFDDFQNIVWVCKTKIK